MTTSESASEPNGRKLSPVVACTLSGDDLRARAERWRRLRHEAGLECSETDDGLRLSFRDERAVEEELRALVAVESECCAWARWEMRREDGDLVLGVSSTGGGVAALQAIFSSSGYDLSVADQCRVAAASFHPMASFHRVWRSARMRLPNTAHTSRPWRIHELTRDFRLEDVWALPTPGGRGDFPRLVQLMSSGDPSQDSSHAARALWAIRWKVGELLDWDSPVAGLGSRVPTLRDRLPVDLRDAPSGPDFDALPFTSLYLLADEWAAEIANRTMHGVMHIGWVPDAAGAYRGQMAVYVKPNGLLGAGYIAAIRPFRHLIVYPAMLRQIKRGWRARTGEPTAGGAAAAPEP